MTHIHTRGPNIDSRESVVSGAIPEGCCGERSFFHCTINARDLIEDDARTALPYMRVRSGSFEGVIVKLACKLGQ